MKKLFFLFILFAFSSKTSLSLDYLPNVIIIKFHKEFWENDYNKNEKQIISLLEDYLGEFTIREFINSKLLDYALNRHNNLFKNTGDNPVNSLKRIFWIEYVNNIDPQIASHKLRNFPFFEYVQPAYISKINVVSDDPRIPEQYHHLKINTFKAWDFLNTTDTIIVGVVDTGVDIDHEDLQTNIFYNQNEMGLDSNGNDKSTNGIDDDGNGYVDDYVGWDFAGNDGHTPDNNPRPGNGHGTHVAGIIGAVANNAIGIAGVVPQVKILPVKAANDEQFNTFITKGYEGILYAAIMGAKVINCSWGSESSGSLENDIIRAVNFLGACVVAAAGNDGKYSDFAPASLNGVLSVAAVDSNDVKAGFSNFSLNVDVSAPGVKILSTTPNNTYAAWDGTSMASPIAAGVVALARLNFPNLNFEQIYELVKKQSDNIDSLNPLYSGLLGAGRVNAFKTLNCNPDTIRSIILMAYSTEDLDGDNLFLPNDTIKVNIKVKNVFSDLTGVIGLVPDDIHYVKNVIKSKLYIGAVPNSAIVQSPDSVLFVLSDTLPLDFSLKVPIFFYDSLGLISRYYLEIQVNPSYRNMSYNKISTTFNSRGNIGFNDYPQNKQGIGFVFKNSPNILFEGGLILGYSPANIYDVVRGANQNRQNRDFIPSGVFKVIYDDTRNLFVGESNFFTRPDSLETIEFSLNLQVLQPISPPDSNVIFLNYQLKNISQKDLDSVFLGLFFDWDIGLSGQSDICAYDRDYEFGYAHNTTNDTLPWVGVKILNSPNVNFYAIDNDGRGEDVVGIYDGFTKLEKWNMLSGNLRRLRSRATDASMIIASGPYYLPKDSSLNLVYAIFAGGNIFELRKSSFLSHQLAYEYNLIKNEPPKSFEPYKIAFFPNPFEEDCTLRISFLDKSPIEIFVHDNLGRLISSFSFKDVDNIENSLGLNKLASGTYYLTVQTSLGTRYYLLTKIK
ncbi:MAG: S8 family serine peptidase [Candidatus Kapaibacteriota bacterium]